MIINHWVLGVHYFQTYPIIANGMKGGDLPTCFAYFHINVLSASWSFQAFLPGASRIDFGWILSFSHIAKNHLDPVASFATKHPDKSFIRKIWLNLDMNTIINHHFLKNKPSSPKQPFIQVIDGHVPLYLIQFFVVPQVERSLSGEAQMKEDEAALRRLEVVQMARTMTPTKMDQSGR